SRPRERDASGVGGRTVPAIDRRAVAGRHVMRVHEVLDADRHAMEEAAFAGLIALARFGDGTLGIEIFPGTDDGFPFGDAGETAAGQGFRSQAAGGDRSGGSAGREVGEV